LVVFKYYLGERGDRFRPFAGLGTCYTRFTNTHLNPVFRRKLASLGGLLAAAADIGSLQSLLLDPAWFQRVWAAGGDLLLSLRTNVSAKVKSVWEPVFTVGASYPIDHAPVLDHGNGDRYPAAHEDHARHQPAEPDAGVQYLRYFREPGAGKRVARIPVLRGGSTLFSSI